MSGSELFKKFRVLIYIFVLFCKFMPSFLLRFVWGCVSSFDGRVAAVIRYAILKSRAKSCGENVFIGSNVVIKSMEKLVVGDSVSIHANCYLDCAGGVIIGDDVSIAHNSSVVSFEHTWADPSLPIKYNPTQFGPIEIHDDVWIGCGARILSGTLINSRIVIAAGAVVKGELLACSLYAGVPVKRIKGINA